ncbi:MAG TPA: type I DNA topoisomerase [Acidobacteriota bacterium]|nr:type I DNA topoisomerase [Acidobacteriota bacterium]
MPSLVIVESPAKAKTISRVLGKDYVVDASYGHLRDLPAKADEIPARYKKKDWSRLGVNVEEGFEPLYVIPQDKKRHVKRLKEALKDADALLLATDEDREGESISWHAVEVLKPKVPVGRIAFHEITSEAILAALKSPRDIDDALVKAQESRRILDRLFGYMLSPLLWKKVRRGLSAGRVQSVAVRLAVLRERQRKAFRVSRYLDAEAEFKEEGISFTARLNRVGQRRVASGKDFDSKTGQLKANSDALWLAEDQQVDGLIAGFGKPWQVIKAEQKPFTRRPAPPFTTSSMQQEANRKLGFSADRTMRVAQRLYEGVDMGPERVGLITYMRTDSLTLANRALQQAQGVIQSRYGKEYAKGPRRYRTKSKGAQEAHEAIRPTELSRPPGSLSKYLNRDEQRLYELIWKRTLASQMADAELTRTSVEIEAPLSDGPDGARSAIFNASGQTVRFPGFLRVYVEGSDDPAAELADREVMLPPLKEGQQITPRKVEAKDHQTQPPARYTEASLVKKLEAEGIGRPSTYASIVQTIQDRGYIVKTGNALVPTFIAFAVTQLLERHFSDYVDIKFTARMENDLDDIASGELDPLDPLQRIYHGNGLPGLKPKIASEEGQIEYPAVEIGTDPELGQVVVKIGRFGPYLQAGEDDDRIIASLPEDVAPADFSLKEAVELLKKKDKGPRKLGVDPESGKAVYAATGRYGAYVQLGETPEGKGKKKERPKRASLPKGVSEEEATLEVALKWLSLPRVVGTHPEKGEEILATSGRYGPHLRCGKETRSLESDEQIFNITLQEAVAKINEPKRKGRSRSKKVLKELGDDPNTEGTKVQVLDGPYGPYITNGELNASLPKNLKPEEVSKEQALQILADKGKAPKRKRRRRKAKAK